MTAPHGPHVRVARGVMRFRVCLQKHPSVAVPASSTRQRQELTDGAVGGLLLRTQGGARGSMDISLDKADFALDAKSWSPCTSSRLPQQARGISLILMRDLGLQLLHDRGEGLARRIEAHQDIVHMAVKHGRSTPRS